MIVDSTALPEQAVRDILASAFQSAGQRCSALRMLYVQEDVARARCSRCCRARWTRWRVGDPWLLATDVGPVIDDEARRRDRAPTATSCAARARLLEAARRAGGGPLRRARVSSRSAGIARSEARDLRAGAARRDASRPSELDARGRRDQRPRLRPDLRPPHAASTTRVERVVDARPRRQHLRQPQPDRRRGRLAALRRRGPVGHRPQGRRAALPAPLPSFGGR